VTLPARTVAASTAPALVPSARQRLLPPPFRLAAIIVVAACAITVSALGALFYHGSRPDALDKAVFRLVWPHRSGLTPLANVGDTVPIALLTAVLCYCCLAMRRYRGALMVAFAVPVAAAATELLKHVIHRIYINFLSFPSGHTTATFAVITCVVVLLINPPASKAPASMRIVLAATSAGAGVAVALGLVAARFHYFTDTIGGAAVGIGVVLAFALLLDSVASPVAAADGAPAETVGLLRTRDG
jgi:membrane-associated phospholipid phosphatase